MTLIQEGAPTVGQVAAVDGCPLTAISAGFSSHGFSLVLWISPPIAARYIAAGGFWTRWDLGEASWVRFQHRVNTLKRALFEAVEIRRVADGDAPGPDALWLPAASFSPQQKAVP